MSVSLRIGRIVEGDFFNFTKFPFEPEIFISVLIHSSATFVTVSIARINA
jgi:hypothetical protein